MLPKTLLLVGFIAPVLARSTLANPGSSTQLVARHHDTEDGHTHGEEDDHSDHEESHEDHGEDEHGDHGDHGDHGGDTMDFGQFNFTETGISWSECASHCAHEFLDYIPEPINNPLCNNDDFYQNVTACVAESCSEHDQGAYAVGAEIECPDEDDFAAAAVRSRLGDDGGEPQECEAVDDSRIECENGTDSSDSAAGRLGQAGGAATLLTCAMLMALPLGLLL